MYKKGQSTTTLPPWASDIEKKIEKQIVKELEHSTATHGEEVTAMPPPQAPAYVVDSSKSKVCAQGYQPITEAASCKAAAKDLGLHYASAVEWLDAPHGCFMSMTGVTDISPSVWFNEDAGKEHPEGLVICEQVSPWNGVCPSMYTLASGVPSTLLAYVDRGKAWKTCSNNPDCCAVSEVDSAARTLKTGKSLAIKRYRLGSCDAWQEDASWKSCRKEALTNEETQRQGRMTTPTTSPLFQADDRQRLLEGEVRCMADLQPSFTRVGSGYCLNAKGLPVNGNSTRAKSVLDCKSKCAESEQCHAIQWRTSPLFSCTLLNQTLTKSTGSQADVLDPPGGSECWNKYAPNHSTKILRRLQCSRNMLNKLYTRILGRGLTQ